MQSLLKEIKQCKVCEPQLPLGARPVVVAHPDSKILIIGQAPGTKVHASGKAWDDKSGERLREWMDVSETDFYDEKLMAIVPMGFCYPGKGKSGDLPPRKECAPLWHNTLIAKMPKIRLTLLIGNYAQAYYLPDNQYKTLTERVKHFNEFSPKYFPLPHPSPRNNIWLRKNEWFEQEAIPFLRERIQEVIG